MSTPELRQITGIVRTINPRTDRFKLPRGPRKSDSRGFYSRFLRKPLGVAGLIFIVLVILLAIFAPLVATYDPIATDLLSPLAPPSPEHWLGTDSLGRDTWSRLVWGARPTLMYALVPVITGLAVGVPVGMLSGYYGGRVDRTIMWISDVGLAVPGIVLLLVVLSMFSSQFWIAMAFFGFLGAPGLIRFVRGATLSVRKELFIDAALVAGKPHGYIIARHVFPRIRGLLLVQATLLLAGGVMLMAGMGYLGYGPKPPTPTWGSMMTDAQSTMALSPWLLLVSGGAILLTVLALGLIGDAVRDASVEAWAHLPPAPPRRKPVRRATGAVHAPVEPATPGALLDVRGLSVAFQRGDRLTSVVDDVTFSIAPGERVALVGESGCGKSTVASAIVRLLAGTGEITAGSIAFDGADVLGLSGAALRGYRGGSVGYVSQEPMAALDPSFRIDTQLAEAIRAHQPGRRDVKGRVRELLAQVQIADVERVAKSYPHELSGGMAQRVCIARALAGEPRLLIADEPTTALDVTVQAEILNLLRTLADEHDLAVLLISHDWGVVAELCTRSIVMYAGQIVEQADVGELLGSSAHPYTRGLLSCRPSTVGHDVEELPVIGGSVPDPRDWPTSCRFAARCPMAVDACREAPIASIGVAPGHESRCLFAQELIQEKAHV